MRVLAASVVLCACVVVVVVAGGAVAWVGAARRPAARPSLPRVHSWIWSVPVSGGRPQLLVHDRGQDAFPVVRRDGSVVFVRPTSLTTTGLFELRDGRERRLRSVPFFAPVAYAARVDRLVVPRTPVAPAISADGRARAWTRTVHTRSNPYQSRLVVRRGRSRRAFDLPGVASGVALSPTGDRVLFENARRLLLLDVATGLTRMVARRGAWPSWSPVGDTIAYSDGRGVVFEDLTTGRLWRGPARAAAGSFSPDGRSYVYAGVSAAQSIPK